MFCGSCGAKNDAGFKFCDTCGATLDGQTLDYPTSPSATQAAPVVLDAQSQTPPQSVLNLTTLAGFRWLFATNYGQLSISDNLLNHQMHKLWATSVYSVIVKIFSWGLDLPSTLFVTRGFTNLKEINTVRIFAIDWIVWKGHFIFIWSGGWPDIYWFSIKQLDEVEAFVASLKKAIAEAKSHTAN
jgi:hypothetical protein